MRIRGKVAVITCDADAGANLSATAAAASGLNVQHVRAWDLVCKIAGASI